MIGKTVFFCPHESDKEAYAYGKVLTAIVVGKEEHGYNLQVLRNGPGNMMFRGNILNAVSEIPEGHFSKSRFYTSTTLIKDESIFYSVEKVAPDESPLMERARDEDGRYKGDDPDTPENEAYTEVAEPAKKRSFKEILTGKPSK